MIAVTEVGRWDEARQGPLSEARLAAWLESQGYAVTRYVYPPGTVFPEHTHAVDKIDAVVSGRFALTLGGRRVVLGPGRHRDPLPGAVHSAEVVGDQPVVSLDAVRRR